MRALSAIPVLLLLAMKGGADDIDLEVHSGTVLKMLREVTDKTNATDSLNLPANASSIRENITDTFSCENRTYGYYADVDNECQVFHICYPSQTPSGRNVTYRWSFICPAETVFNQEVLVCTRPIDAIPCDVSEDYFDINMEFGKIPPKEDTGDDAPTKTPEKIEEKPARNKNNRNSIQKRKPDHRKQNIVLDNLIENINKEMKEKLQNMEFENVGEIFPDVNGKAEEFGESEKEFDERIAMERSMGANRFRFRADV